ncbi:MAG: tRNA pseudouridine(55) synthase TruB [Pyrinomonadaceae bacterium]
MDGILIIDKPAWLTSHDVVARVRRILKTKRVGHTGTLDPFATGVMVILVGKATRLAKFLDKDEKEYEAVVRFGFETDTGDRTGSPKSRIQGQNSISVNEIHAALDQFRGEIEQTPPMYSAKKIDGKKLYELARKGLEVERKAVRIKISKLEVYEIAKDNAAANDFGPWTLDVGLTVACSAGTYIRTLAEDIGRVVGSGAHLAELRRTRAGKFELAGSVTIGELQDAEDPKSYLIRMEEAVSHIPSVVMNADRAAKTLNGLSTRILDLEFKNAEAIQMLNEDKEIIAIGLYNEEEKTVQPKIVLS